MTEADEFAFDLGITQEAATANGYATPGDLITGVAAQNNITVHDWYRAWKALGAGRSIPEYKAWADANPETLTPPPAPAPEPAPVPAPAPLPAPAPTPIMDPDWGAGDIRLSDIMADQRLEYLGKDPWTDNLNNHWGYIKKNLGIHRTLWIDGLFPVIAPIQFRNPCNVYCTNPSSGLFAEMVGEDAVTFGDPFDPFNPFVCSELWVNVWGGQCRNALSFYNCYNCDINVQARGGGKRDASGYGGHAVVFGSCMTSTVRVICSLNYNRPNGIGGYGLGAWEGAAVKIEDITRRPGWKPGTALPVGNNANKYDFILEGGTATSGLWVQAQPISDSGNSRYTGTIQGFRTVDSYGILFEGGWHPKFRDLHIESCTRPMVVRDTTNIQAVDTPTFDGVLIPDGSASFENCSLLYTFDVRNNCQGIPR